MHGYERRLHSLCCWILLCGFKRSLYFVPLWYIWQRNWTVYFQLQWSLPSRYLFNEYRLYELRELPCWLQMQRRDYSSRNLPCRNLCEGWFFSMLYLSLFSWVFHKCDRVVAMQRNARHMLRLLWWSRLPWRRCRSRSMPSWHFFEWLCSWWMLELHW